MLPVIFIGLLTRSLNKRLSSYANERSNQDEIDYIFASMINTIKITEEENGPKTNI